MFSLWELRPELLAALVDQGITNPTPVQQEVYPMVLAGRDLLVQSRTGTGKTLAFGLPILQRTEEGPGPVEALVVLPTRELAMQVAAALTRASAGLRISVALLYGGGSYTEQLQSLRNGARVVVGTPGRLCDHQERGTLRLDQCSTLVLDEADEILDLGFAEELNRLLEALPSERQSLLFSATLPPEMADLAARTLRNPHRLALSQGLTAPTEIAHGAYEVEREHRVDALVNVLHVERPQLGIVFCHTRAETEQVAERLRSEGLKAAALNGEMAQGERTRTLNAFRRRHTPVLVATDVAARGIDVRGVTHVINLGVPQAAEAYIHRVGRTGRAGDAGQALTFVPRRDSLKFRRMLQLAGLKVEFRPVPQAEDVRKKLREAFHGEVCRRVASGTDHGLRRLASELLDYVEPLDLVAALLEGDEAARSALEAGLEVPVPAPRPERPRLPAHASWTQRPPHAPRPGGPKAHDAGSGRPASRRGMLRVQVNHGQSQHMTPARLVRLVCQVAGLKGHALGPIEVRPHSCLIDIREAEAPRVARELTGLALNGRKMKARVVA